MSSTVAYVVVSASVRVRVRGGVPPPAGGRSALFGCGFRKKNSITVSRDREYAHSHVDFSRPVAQCVCVCVSAPEPEAVPASVDGNTSTPKKRWRVAN